MCTKNDINNFINQKKFLIEQADVVKQTAAINGRSGTGAEHPGRPVMAVGRLAGADVLPAAEQRKAVAGRIDVMRRVIEQHSAGGKRSLRMPVQDRKSTRLNSS